MSCPSSDPGLAPAPVELVVVGCGGAIGSHLIPHLARNRQVGRLVLIDADVYEASNLAAQDIRPADIGRAKADVQADRIRELRPDVDVVSIRADVETIPAGRLRADAMLTCVDSRRTRQYVNLVTRRLGLLWIDAGVLGGQLLARIDVFRADDSAPCMECAWGPAEYAALEQRYPCATTGRGDGSGGVVSSYSTGASSGLGALAAALQAIELDKHLAGRGTALGVGEQVVLDADAHAVWRTRHQRRPRCLLPEHDPWTIHELAVPDTAATVSDLLDLAEAEAGGGSAVDRGPSRIELRLDPLRLATRWICEGCGAQHYFGRISSRVGETGLPCPGCGRRLHPLGVALTEVVTRGRLDASTLATPLSETGLDSGDLLTAVSAWGERHYELIVPRA